MQAGHGPLLSLEVALLFSVVKAMLPSSSEVTRTGDLRRVQSKGLAAVTKDD